MRVERLLQSLFSGKRKDVMTNYVDVLNLNASAKGSIEITLNHINELYDN